MRTISTLAPVLAWIFLASGAAQAVENAAPGTAPRTQTATDSSRAGGAAMTAERRGGSDIIGRTLTGLRSTCGGELVDLEPGQSYRLDGWIRCRRGSAMLWLDLLDAAGRIVGVQAAPSVSSGPGWQYTAAEEDAPEQAKTARIWLKVAGEADVRGVNLVPMVRNLVYNPGFDGDSKGRIGMWSQEAPEDTEGGSIRVDAAGRTGTALYVEAGTEGWGARCVAWPALEGVTAYRFSGWARGRNSEPQIRILWLDAWEKTVREDPVDAAGVEGGWTHYERRDITPPADATTITVAGRVANGGAWFDDFLFAAQRLAARTRPVARVLVNQVGYDVGAPKSVVVATNFFPQDPDRACLIVTSAAGSDALRVPLRCAGRIYNGKPDDWGSYCWRADFSSLDSPGVYTARAVIGKTSASSPRFIIGQRALFGETADLGVEFFFVQRCGFDVPGWHKACHLDDANLADGTHIDAVGGWHSAGDYNKIMYENGDGGVMYALVSAYLSEAGRFDSATRNGDRLPRILDEAWWGAKFVAKMQVSGTGALYNTVAQGPGRAWMKWSPPEVHTDNIVGTADDPVIQPGEGHSPLAIGGWARLSVLLKRRGIENDYLERAVRLWQHATNDGASIAGGHLLLSAVELHAVTGEAQYLDAARRCAEAILSSQRETGRLRGAFGSYGEVDAGALAFLALRYPDDPLSPRIKRALRDWVSFARSTADNPFGLSKQSVGDRDYFFEPTSALGHNWELLTRAWAANLIWRLNRDRRAARYATDQMDWVLGKNPYGLCMFEGKGAFNPPRYHHRYDSIPGHERGAVPGCVPNGFVRTPSGYDQPGFDLSRPAPGKRHPSYRTSEPWLTHNMWFLMAVSARP